jgi:hypothetical protein
MKETTMVAIICIAMSWCTAITSVADTIQNKACEVQSELLTN